MPDSTSRNCELLKALRAPNSPYKKVGVLREFHNTAATVIEQLEQEIALLRSETRARDACSVTSRFWLVRYADGSIEDLLFYERSEAERWIKREFPRGPEERGIKALPNAMEVQILEAE